MKERYFSAASIKNLSREMVKETAAIARMRSLQFEPERSALLVLDMQSYFLKEESHAYIPSSEAILPGIRALIQTYLACDRPVVFTRHLNSGQNAGVMSRWWRDLIQEEDPLSQITLELDTSAGIVIRKCQYDAFYQTNLDDFLRSEAVDQVVVCGVMTHLCCETTARSAFVRGFEVFFPVDGTATYNQAFHKATLMNLSHGFAVITLMDEILAAMGMGNAH